LKRKCHRMNTLNMVEDDDTREYTQRFIIITMITLQTFVIILIFLNCEIVLRGSFIALSWYCSFNWHGRRTFNLL